MRRFAIVLAFAAATVFSSASAVLADPLADLLREVIDESADEGDHVVGEEMCARPVIPR